MFLLLSVVAVGNNETRNRYGNKGYNLSGKWIIRPPGSILRPQRIDVSRERAEFAGLRKRRR
ncbi:MAG: hypothetical protein ABR915_19320 [Thermoguttaceae bacterium]|jgi:hypothetical protein